MKDNQKLIDVLKQAITETNEMWANESHPHAYIIGWLQGTIKGAISELEATDKYYEYKLKQASKTN